MHWITVTFVFFHLLHCVYVHLIIDSIFNDLVHLLYGKLYCTDMPD